MADGQKAASANLPMGGFRHTNVDDAAARTDYARADQVQDSGLTYLTSVSGTNTVTATAPLSMAAYAAGQVFRFIPANTNTGATTININSIGAKNLFLGGVACVGGELTANVPAEIIYDGTQFQLMSLTAFSRTRANKGKIILPGNLLLQWGQIALSAATVGSDTFAQAYGSTPYSCTLGGTTGNTARITTLNTTTVEVTMSGSSTGTIYYQAIGPV